MTSETAPPDRVAHPTSPTCHFAMRFSSTPRGARLARRLAGQRFNAWGIPYDYDPHHALTLIVAELAPDRSARKAAWRMIRREEGLDDDV
ncbi:hypothetical protein [Streptomyces mirabilis]|uniref:hypothetical protein n=1 Tax=Streptomyces mirabilis TaxID=68239 RepID=UPI000765CA5A|nr:hypothetical protein [Streptomyces mirabilis]